MKIPLTPLRVLTASILCAIPQASHAEVVVTPSEGFTLIWDGNDGDGFNPESPAPVPVNLANAQGAIPFTSSDLGPLLGIPFHVAANINDGFYGNANSWIGGNTPTPYAAIRLNGLATLSSFAFGRDNGNGAFDDSSPEPMPAAANATTAASVSTPCKSPGFPSRTPPPLTLATLPQAGKPLVLSII